MSTTARHSRRVETVRAFGMLAAGFGAVILFFSVLPAAVAGATAAPSVQPSKSCGNYCALPSPTTSQNAHPDGSVGNADNKNPKGQAPNGSDHNKGYECDSNKGIGNGNPAHTVNCPSPAPPLAIGAGQLSASWPCGAANPTYTVPTPPAHAVYSQTSGTHAGTAGALVSVGVVYDAGFTGPSSISVTLPSAPAPCGGSNTAGTAAPSVTDSICVNGSPTTPTFTVPNSPHIVYSPPSGTYPGTPGATTTVTAAPEAGWALAAGAQSSFGITFAAAPVCSSATQSPSPSASPLAGGGGGGATAPTPKPKPSVKPAPKPVAGGGGGGAVQHPVSGGGALPFTGDRSSSLLRVGLGLVLFGLCLTMVPRRRVVVE